MEPYKLRHSGKENSEIPTSSSEYPHIGIALSRLKAAMIVKGSHQAPIQSESLGVIPILKASTQRIAVTCRGSWMPGASEVFGCPQIFFSHLPTFSSFLHIFRMPPISWMPFFYRKLGCWMPPGWMPGAVAPPAPLCTPLAHSL